MPKIDLSIIIISYNTRQITKNCVDSVLKSLKNAQFSFEVVVVDNASRDGSAEMLKNYELRITNYQLIQSKVNLGFGKGNNLGVKHARGETILLLNSDTLIIGNAIEDLYNFFDQQSLFKFLGGKLLNKDLTSQPSCGPFYSLTVVFGALFLKGDYWGLTRYSPDQPRQVDWISGACIMTRKSDFERLGGFDEKIFMYMEEIDLLYRARKLDYRTGIYPQAKFIHLGSASSEGRTYPIIQVYNGFLYFYKKHCSQLELLLLKFLLKLKALISWSLGKLTGNKYLTETYGKAYKMV